MFDIGDRPETKCVTIYSESFEIDKKEYNAVVQRFSHSFIAETRVWYNITCKCSIIPLFLTSTKISDTLKGTTIFASKRVKFEHEVNSLDSEFIKNSISHIQNVHSKLKLEAI